MKRSFVVVAGAVLAFGLAHAVGSEAGDETIKVVMEKAHKKGLLKKVMQEKAEAKEKIELLGLYADMYDAKPPMGEEESWIELAGKSVAGAGRVVVGREGCLDGLKEATSCKECHDAHKPDPKKQRAAFALPDEKDAKGKKDDDDRDPEPVHSTKDIMKEAFKGELLKTVLGGKATAEEKARFLDLAIGLWENKPPRGEAADWHRRSGAILSAAAHIVAGGEEESLAKLKEAANCKDCHSGHKPPAER